jgi:hypothetical protein
MVAVHGSPRAPTPLILILIRILITRTLIKVSCASCTRELHEPHAAREERCGDPCYISFNKTEQRIEMIQSSIYKGVNDFFSTSSFRIYTVNKTLNTEMLVFFKIRIPFSPKFGT